MSFITFYRNISTIEHVTKPLKVFQPPFSPNTGQNEGKMGGFKERVVMYISSQNKQLCRSFYPELVFTKEGFASVLLAQSCVLPVLPVLCKCVRPPV